MLTDTHANDEEADRMANLRRVFAAVAAEDPQFVLHCGDITDFGDDSGFEAYRASIPAALWDRIRHTPGNHEIRWDVTARERFRRWFGPTSYSFDVGGVHFLALDPTQLLQEPGLFGDDLETIRRDLEGAGAMPSIMFLHYPLSGRNHYVNDADALLRTIEPYPVRGIFAGHIHRNEVDRFNGLTQVAAINTRSGPFYLRVTERADGLARVLVVEQVTLGASDADAPTADLLAEIPLNAGPGETAGPVRAGARIEHDRVALSAIAGPGAVDVSAQLYAQELFGAVGDREWVPLNRTGGSWSGALDATALPPGVHRIRFRAADASGAFWHETVTVERRGRSISMPKWELALGGQIQGALAAFGTTVVAASTAGNVTALRITGAARHVMWERNLGAVHRATAFTTDGSMVIVPSADHTLTALDAARGTTRWRTDLSRPVMSTPAVFNVGGADRVVVAAGDRLFCLDARGAVLWESEVPRLSAGRAGSDGSRVYVGAGDGRGYAYDLNTGAPLWSVLTNTRPDTYRQLIYGPWDDWIEVLPTGAVLFSTVTNAIAVDPVTGAERWRLDGSYIYAPGVALPDGGLLLTTEWGVVDLIDPATGVRLWSAQAVPRAVNAGPVRDVRSGRVWLVGVGGQLTAIDPATGDVTVDRQLFTANTFSTPVIVGRQLIVGAQDGVIRGITV
ncbi:PQQ-binding-like beta-propeller repeat protein [Microbacterium sp. zg.Y1090]|uniref:outer membrane protein assembly factor BamB family protein n=1 Tax=Microbacterium wangruii TaxID=3049073 RepID=UPI00214DABAE|nr:MULTISPECIES: PQQ-binding-like beta-propeller repeat protein [unclassified Microbacterium]MCR2818805.1 PQQ-binding-like beta-propeller repeat protein [Microbacterium sp. zg.Y1090]WIM27119.1 PQQ-binding-like beta-propeller repeat protein [Microbacterium sp. zg-Y1090]